MAVLEIEKLNTVFASAEGDVRACRNINLYVEKGETVGIIGETGCGKSVLGMSVLQLLPDTATIDGRVLYKGINLLEFNEEEMEEMRGKEIGLLPQSPATSLNPTMKIGKQIEEGFVLHRKMTKKEAEKHSLILLNMLGLKDPEKIMRSYPHELSGGMRQRVLAAVAVSGNPELLIADEPTKGLDPVTRRQMIDLLKKVSKESGAAMILITHDLDLAEEICDRVAVMYSGEFFEVGDAKTVLRNPLHPYTEGLINSLPSREMKPVPGSSPGLSEDIRGCRFYERCQKRNLRCKEKSVFPIIYDQREVRCLLYD